MRSPIQTPKNKVISFFLLSLSQLALVFYLLFKVELLPPQGHSQQEKTFTGAQDPAGDLAHWTRVPNHRPLHVCTQPARVRVAVAPGKEQ